MKTVQVSEVTGIALDWLVAKCEGHESRCAWMLEKDGYVAWQNYEQAWGHPIPMYSTDGGIAVPIIERERIRILTNSIVGRTATGVEIDQPDGWAASKPKLYWQHVSMYHGPTFLIAAMRCYVASKLGDTVEVPDGLT